MDLQIMGNIIPNAQKLKSEMIKKIGFMIMDKNTDPFELHVRSITPISDDNDAHSDHSHEDHSLSHHHVWYSVNDDVMGGESEGQVTVKDDQVTFWGELSFENNGGFASARTDVVDDELNGSHGIKAVLIGDGRTYKFTTHKQRHYGMWSTVFETKVGEQITIHFPYNEMVYSYHGRPDPNQGEITAQDIQSVGFMMSDKQEGPFELKVLNLEPYTQNDKVGHVWYSVNDDVMGGESEGQVTVEDDQVTFWGELSFENNGGFASARTDIVDDELKGSHGIQAVLTGDGRSYKFTTHKQRHYGMWSTEFDTRPGEQITIQFPFDEMVYSYHGRPDPNQGQITAQDIQSVGFMMSDKQEGPFMLKLHNLEPYTHNEKVNHVWYAVNDDVMGGESEGKVTVEDDQVIFWGELSFENNGGFASVRTDVVENELKNSDGIRVVLIGDGRTYKFTSHKHQHYGMWSTVFKTKPGEEVTIHFPFDEMVYSYHGRPDPNQGQITAEEVKSIGFMMSDKQEGPFELKVRDIEPYSRSEKDYKFDRHEFHPETFNVGSEEVENLANWYSNNWYSVNDDVMGGVSHGSPARNKETHNLKFWGALSMENNGGFSTIRTDLDSRPVGACGVDIHVRGDGRQYQFCAYPGDMKGRYQTDIETTAGQDTKVSIMLDELEYHFWGWKKPMKSLVASNLKGLGFMIADKNTAPFELEIVSVKLNYCSETPKMNMVQVSEAESLMDLDWYALNDGVMGGISSGSVKVREGMMHYKGKLSLERRGGFSTIRANVPETFAKSDELTGVEVEFVGSPGRSFKLNLGKSTNDMNYNAWSYTLSPEADFKTIKIPFAAFKHEKMGRAPAMPEGITAGEVRKVSFQISDKNTDPFELHVASINFY